jgi:hypothetical protein
LDFGYTTTALLRVCALLQFALLVQIREKLAAGVCKVNTPCTAVCFTFFVRDNLWKVVAALITTLCF